jgi:hypothetical protein
MGRLVIAGIEFDVEFKNGHENLRTDFDRHFHPFG